MNIIQNIYSDSKNFEKDALQLISRKVFSLKERIKIKKVAAVSGDVRRCLDVCQKSIEISKSELSMKNKEDSNSQRTTRYSSNMHVSIKDVMKAILLMFSSMKTEAIKLVYFGL